MSANLDFETYSEAPIIDVGAYVYAEHPSTRVISLAYSLNGKLNLWLPWMPAPDDLLEHVAKGGLCIAWNAVFEFLIWNKVCVPQFGWPSFHVEQMQCSMAQARVYTLPGKLLAAGVALDLEEVKDIAGNSLINIFSKPSKVSNFMELSRKNFPVEKLESFYKYNLQDVRAEATIAKVTPELSIKEREIWLLDQKINLRGVYIDIKAAEIFSMIVAQEEKQGIKELQKITGSEVLSISEVAKIRKWFSKKGLNLRALDSEAVEKALAQKDLPDTIRRVLELRQELSLSSVKKLQAILARTSQDSRVRGLFQYYGANTGRFAGRGAQPQNLPNSGLAIKRCECGKTYAAQLENCPHCNLSCAFSAECVWDEQAFADLATHANGAKRIYLKPVEAVSSCLRGLFCAAPGHDLICSDYSSIEAVVLANIAGESWRIQSFKNGEDIYKMSASQMLGVPLEHITKEQRRLGKIAELASGYQGAVGAWKRFGAEDFLTEEQILNFVKLWRQKSPRIVLLWNKIFEAAANAITQAGYAYGYAGIVYQVDIARDVLCCLLPSGRILYYHSPQFSDNQIFFKAYETVGGWQTQSTYGGKLVENIVQAIARDILCEAMLRVEKAGYTIVLHVHDEIVCEIPEGWGSLEEFEALMSQMPEWASNWGVVAKGGWRGKRYKK